MKWAKYVVLVGLLAIAVMAAAGYRYVTTYRYVQEYTVCHRLVTKLSVPPSSWNHPDGEWVAPTSDEYVLAEHMEVMRVGAHEFCVRQPGHPNIACNNFETGERNGACFGR